MARIMIDGSWRLQRASRLLVALMVFTLTLAAPAHAQQQSFDGLRVSVISYRWGGKGLPPFDFSVTLMLENMTAERGAPQEIAVAAYKNSYLGWSDRAPRSSIQDRLNGMQGWLANAISGLDFGETADQWVRIRPGGSIPVTLSFTNCCNVIDAPFFVTAEFKLYKFNGAGHQTVPIYLGPFGSAPVAPPVYPR